jgi:hypothetical protein
LDDQEDEKVTVRWTWTRIVRLTELAEDHVQMAGFGISGIENSHSDTREIAGQYILVYYRKQREMQRNDIVWL